MFDELVVIMKLNQQQRDRLNQHLAENWQAPVACSVCRSNNWGVSDHVYELREFNGGAMTFGGSGGIVPLCPVSCNNCGNTVLINPLIAGIDLGGEQNGQ
ncbi:TPA: hypothetical protein ACN33Q_004798 [Vibrio parahaemolyticus]